MSTDSVSMTMIYNRLYVLASVVLLIYILVQGSIFIYSNAPRPACINDDYHVFYTEVVVGNSTAPLHYLDDNGYKHYNYGADIVLVDNPITDELCEKYFER